MNQTKSEWNKSESDINKKDLKINYKNLPKTTDLKLWGDLNVMFGDYPVKDQYQNMVAIEAKVLSKNNIIEITNNFVVLIKKNKF